MPARQTLAREISATGIALHAGVPVRMTLAPAPADSGIVFRRSDLGGAEIPARYDLVCETRLGTVIARDGISIGVIEHLMAAVAGAGLDDCLVTLDGPEPPILDGDALSYLTLIESAGLRDQSAPRMAIRVLREIRIEQKEAHAILTPADRTSYVFEIDFPASAIGRQHFALDFSASAFRSEIAPARTFGFLRELEALNKMNLARGASLENTLALDAGGVVNAGLMRFADEFVRHKILDAVGDMALARAPLLARFTGVKSGHAVNNAVLRALFADPANYERVAAP